MTVLSAGPSAPAGSTPEVHRTPRHPLKRGLFWIAVALIVIWSVGPFVWQLNASFQLDKNLASSTPNWFPFPDGTFQHYVNVFAKKDFSRYIVNSIVVPSMRSQ